MADEPTATTAYHTAHLNIYATGRAAKPRRDSPTIGYRDHIRQHTLSKGKTNIIGRNKT